MVTVLPFFVADKLSIYFILHYAGVPSTYSNYILMDNAMDYVRSGYLTQYLIAESDWSEHQVTKFVSLSLVEKEDVTLMDDHCNKIIQLALRCGMDKILKRRQLLNDLTNMFHYQYKPLILKVGGSGEY